jgi:serine protease Do
VLADTLDNARGFVVRRLGAILNEPRRTYVLDEPVTFGYIGGPVVTASGRVAGVIGLDLSPAEGGELYTRSGHPLLYQASLFQKYIDRPPAESGAKDQEADEAWLGVYTQPLTDDLAEYWRLPKQGGIVVSTVVAGSPAEGAGIRSGDIVIEFNGKPITAKLDQEVTQFQKIVRESPLGEPLPVAFYRDGERRETSLTLGRRPKTAAAAREYEETVLGLTVRELTQDVRISLNLPEDVEGVIVRRVRSGGPANQARIGPFFVIMRVGDHVIRGVDDYEAAVAAIAEQKPAEVVLFCRVEASTAFYRLLPRWE